MAGNLVCPLIQHKEADMSLNQNQIKDLIFVDVAAAEAAGRPGEICYVQSLKTLYDYVVAGSGYTVNHTSILSTGNGGDTRWRSRSGQYIADMADFVDGLKAAKILVDTSPGADVTGVGMKGVFTNGNAGAVAFGDVCFMAADGDLEFADASAVTSMPGLYMALGVINAAASGEWLILGVVRNDAWDWTIGPGTLGLIYVSITGTTGNTLTQTVPSGVGEQVQIVGHALSADIMMFNPCYVYVEVA